MTWFDYKKQVAPLYKDETNRRLFATASGRRPVRRGDEEDAGEEEDARRLWLAELWRQRWARWRGESEETSH